jgi:hypothetical protein
MAVLRTGSEGKVRARDGLGKCGGTEELPVEGVHTRAGPLVLDTTGSRPLELNGEQNSGDRESFSFSSFLTGVISRILVFSDEVGFIIRKRVDEVTRVRHL